MIHLCPLPGTFHLNKSRQINWINSVWTYVVKSRELVVGTNAPNNRPWNVPTSQQIRWEGKKNNLDFSGRRSRPSTPRPALGATRRRSSQSETTIGPSEKERKKNKQSTRIELLPRCWLRERMDMRLETIVGPTAADSLAAVAHRVLSCGSSRHSEPKLSRRRLSQHDDGPWREREREREREDKEVPAKCDIVFGQQLQFEWLSSAVWSDWKNGTSSTSSTSSSSRRRWKNARMSFVLNH